MARPRFTQEDFSDLNHMIYRVKLRSLRRMKPQLPTGPIQADDEEVHETNAARIVLSLSLGMIAGASAITGYYLYSVGRVLGLQHLQEYGLCKGLSVFKFALVLWTGGLILFAGLPWWLLHRRRYRKWWSAAMLGFGLTFVLPLGLGLYASLTGGNYSTWESGRATVLGGIRTPYGWQVLFLDALKFGALGAFVGLVIWRIAYRRGVRQGSRA